MKKSGVFLILITLFAVAVLLYIETKDDHLDIDIVYLDELPHEEKRIKLYALDSYQNIIPVLVESEKDKLLFIFEVYNFKRNSLPINAFVPLENLLQVERFEKKGKEIQVVVKEEKVEESKMHLLVYLLWLSYSEVGVEKITIINGLQVFSSDDINLLK